jgi:hypothetical protein
MKCAIQLLDFLPGRRRFYYQGPLDAMMAADQQLVQPRGNGGGCAESRPGALIDLIAQARAKDGRSP